MKAFLSSTYLDLVEHRGAASDALQRLGQQVGRMEVFGARPQEPTEACLGEVRQCDIFVGVYAHRYGFVPSGAVTSVTEMELDHAIKHGKPVFCFLVDEDHPWPPSLIDDGREKRKLLELKERIKHGSVVDTFTTPEDLGFKVAAAVGRYLAQGDVTEARDELVESLRECADLADLLEKVLRQLEEVTGTDYNQVFLVATSAYAKQLICVADAVPSGKRRYRIPSFAGLIGTAFSSGKTINAANVHERPGYLQAVPETRAELVVPVAAEAAVYGVLNSEADTTDWFGPERRESAERLARALASTLGLFGWSPAMRSEQLPWIRREPRHGRGRQAGD